jgi:anthranilate phosphoribosyltransferase
VTTPEHRSASPAPASETEGSYRSWPELLNGLVEGVDLDADTSAWAMHRLMSGELNDVEVAGFLTALRAKSETAEELVGLSRAMMENAVEISIPGPTVDIVGTGGDRLGTVNISTMSSLTAVGAGARVVKHGNRGASTTAGAADVIEALGVDLSLPADRVARAVEEVGITFLFAQSFHPSMRFVGPARKQLGIRTVFNFLGPLSNPAHVTAQALGCASIDLAAKMADVLAARKVRGLVFRGRDGRDKITTSEASDIWEVREGQVRHHVIEPEDFGLPRSRVDDLRGGSGQSNADIVHRVLSGERGPIRDAVVLNTAAGLTASDSEAQGSLQERLAANMARAEHSLDSGAAAAVLSSWVAYTQR